MVFSAILPKLIAFFGVKPVYFAGNLIQGFCLLSTLFIHNVYAAITVISLLGIPWAVTMVLPFTIIGQGVDATESGLYMGALNIFVVLPQLLVAVSMGALIHAFNDNDAASFAVGGVSSIIAACCVFFLIIESPVREVNVNSGSSRKYGEDVSLAADRDPLR